jgi:hypothetical protein
LASLHKCGKRAWDCQATVKGSAEIDRDRARAKIRYREVLYAIAVEIANGKLHSIRAENHPRLRG